MSTAHKPTWTPAAARGTANGAISSSGYLTGGSISQQISSRDMPSHTVLKMRDTIPEVKIPDDLKKIEKEEKKEEPPKALTEPEPTINDDFGDFDDSDESDSSNSESDSDSEDEKALLLAELARVKREKELAKQKEEEEKAQMQAALNREEMLHSNPLMFSSEDGGIKRRWDDDVVFRNQGKTEKKQKRFINDTIRSDFHINFMNEVFRQ